MSTSCARLMLAAAASGSGKTTLTCGLVRLIARRGISVAALKCGPDYLDPTFHRRMAGAQTGNLDLFFCDESRVRSLIARDAEGCDIAVLEGVMGYYDGILGEGVRASSYDVARATSTPCVLVLDARGASVSLAAQVKGFATFRTPSQVAGVILNRCTKAVYDVLAPMIEAECGVACVGYVPSDERFALESRHLGLVDADEVADLAARVDALADTLAETLDVERLLALATEAPAMAEPPFVAEPVTDRSPVVAVARDAAFSFYYTENLRLLEDLGARVVAFSPLADEALPEGTCALYLGGGYPELHAARLSANAAMRTALREAIASGLPTVAECGGFMYLQESLEDAEGAAWDMVGALPGTCANEGKLRHFGYIDLEPRGDGLIARAGERLRAHEFHYWHSTHEGDSFVASKPGRARRWDAAVSTATLYAGYPHLFWPADTAPAERLVRAAALWQERRGGGAA